MASRIILILSFTIPLFLFSVISFTNYNQSPPNAEDGPYLLWKGDSLQIIQVDAAAKIQQTTIKSDANTTFTSYIANKDRDQFSFQLQSNLVSPPAVYKQPTKVLAISDIEGNFNAFYSLLVGNGVMDEQYRWTFGEGHLALLGDFVDRGDNVTQCLWLIYKLEQEASRQGGQVHYILGNHEVINLEYDVRYVSRKYISLAQRLSGEADPVEAYQYLMSDKNVLVQWLRTKNCIEKIGDALYVHGGISPELLKTKLKIDDLNAALRLYLQNTADSSVVAKPATIMAISSVGPLWYRGLVHKSGGEYEKTSLENVNQALRYFKVKKIVIGHSVVEEVSTDYYGKVIRIDVQQPIEKRTGKAQALLIEDGKSYRVNDLGERVKLK